MARQSSRRELKGSGGGPTSGVPGGRRLRPLRTERFGLSHHPLSGKKPPKGSGEAQATRPHCHQFLSLTVLRGLQKQRGWDAEESDALPVGTYT